jgi:hypothetical protein
MYGYVVVNKQELKFREFDVYRSYYCGLCHSLGKNHGQSAKLTLSYDFTFLVMLLTGLYEPDVAVYEKRCAVHPAKTHVFRESSVTDYVADMDILMAYYKCIDDWKDDRNVAAKAESAWLKRNAKRVIDNYPQKSKVIERELARLSQYENEGQTDIDTVSSCFGNIMAEMAAMKQDEWQETLKRLGFCLGKFIYILDAYDDLEADTKKNRYNMLKAYCGKEDFEEFILGILNGVMGECARQFEFLPIVQDAEILRNIIYSGVWSRYEQAKKRRIDKKN